MYHSFQKQNKKQNKKKAAKLFTTLKVKMLGYSVTFFLLRRQISVRAQFQKAQMGGLNSVGDLHFITIMTSAIYQEQCKLLPALKVP